MIVRYFSFLVLIALSVYSNFATGSVESCRKHISFIVCLVDAPKNEGARYKDHRPCLDQSSQYVSIILSAYDAYPSFVQKTLCGLNQIYIEKNFFGPAWSELSKENNSSVALVGLRAKDLDAAIPLASFQSWFEQQSFGAQSDFKLLSDGPTVSLSSSKKFHSTGIVFTLLHELGHIVDYQFKLNDPHCEKDCTVNPKSWTTIAWTSLQVPRPNSDFDLRKSICLNNCQGKFISVSDAEKFYSEIYTHGFVSQLAATQAMEDFAESYATYVASKYMNLHFEIHVHGGRNYGLDDVLASKAFLPKLKFIKNLIQDRLGISPL